MNSDKLTALTNYLHSHLDLFPADIQELIVELKKEVDPTTVDEPKVVEPEATPAE